MFFVFVFALFLAGPMAAIEPLWSNGCNISSAIPQRSAIASDLIASQTDQTISVLILRHIVWIDNHSGQTKYKHAVAWSAKHIIHLLATKEHARFYIYQVSEEGRTRRSAAKRTCT